MVEDAITVAPDQYSVVLENDRVRVLEYRDKPGAKTAMHSHPDLVAIGLSSGKFKFSAPGGQSFEIELGAGQAVFTEAASHSTENIGSTVGHALLVELK